MHDREEAYENDRRELLSWLITPMSDSHSHTITLSIKAKELVIILVDFMLRHEFVERKNLQLLGIASLITVCRVN